MKISARLRPVAGEDEEFLYALYASTREEQMAALSWPEAQVAALLRMQFQARRASYREQFPDAEDMVIVSGGQPVGRLTVDRRAEEIRVVDLALLPEARRRGIGRELLGELFAEGERTGKPVRAQVEWCNSALEAFRKIGFRVTGHNGVHYQIERAPGT